MAQTVNVNFRMDEADKKKMERLLEEGETEWRI